jgi:hypothetical protein
MNISQDFMSFLEADPLLGWWNGVEDLLQAPDSTFRELDGLEDRVDYPPQN